MVLFLLSWGGGSIPTNYYLPILAPLHLFICLYPHCAPGCIALGDHLWPATLSRSDLQLCMTALQVVWSLFGSSKPYASLQNWYCNWVQSHRDSTPQCFVNTMYIQLYGTIWDKQTKKWGILCAWLLEFMRLWPAMECVSSLEIMYWFLQTRSVSL